MSIETTPTNVSEQAKGAVPFNEVSIVSDGTKAGTEIKINGKAVPGMTNAWFSCWFDDFSPNVSLSYSTEDVDMKPGTLTETKSFHLIPPEEGAEPSQATGVIRPTDNPTSVPRIDHRANDHAEARRSVWNRMP